MDWFWFNETNINVKRIPFPIIFCLKRVKIERLDSFDLNDVPYILHEYYTLYLRFEFYLVLQFHNFLLMRILLLIFLFQFSTMIFMFIKSDFNNFVEKSNSSSAYVFFLFQWTYQNINTNLSVTAQPAILKIRINQKKENTDSRLHNV